MNLFDFFRASKKVSTASVAKERLQIIVAHERGQRSTPDYLPALQKELVEVDPQVRQYRVRRRARRSGKPGQLLDPGTQYHPA